MGAFKNESVTSAKACDPIAARTAAKHARLMNREPPVVTTAAKFIQ
jgi:hypothetical protein